MKKSEKKALIRLWLKEGRIHVLSKISFAVPAEAFKLGITPRLVKEVVEETKGGHDEKDAKVR